MCVYIYIYIWRERERDVPVYVISRLHLDYPRCLCADIKISSEWSKRSLGSGFVFRMGEVW